MDRIADQHGTPVVIYSKRTLQTHARKFAEAFRPLDPLICFSVKSCWNIHLLKLLTDLGYGLDIVSGGELHRARLTGVAPDKVVYAGVAKSEAEVDLALETGIGLFNVESEMEFEVLSLRAQRASKPINAAVRVNLDIFDPATPNQTATGRGDSKFGVSLDRAVAFFETFAASNWVHLRGLHIHLGSPIPSVETYRRAVVKLLQLRHRLVAKGFLIDILDIGGGFPAIYDVEHNAGLDWNRYAAPIIELLGPFVAEGGQVILEPGRTISANVGILVTAVEYLKQSGTKTYALVDTGMNHFMRPALYGAVHRIGPVTKSSGTDIAYDIAGPICESTDVIARQILLPELARGDRLALFGCGAYVTVLMNQYNSRPRPPEILADGDTFHVIRRRETYDDILDIEKGPGIMSE